MKKVQFIALLTLVALFVGCQEDLSNSHRAALKIAVSDGNTFGNTRAGYSGYSMSFESGDQIGLYVVYNNTVLESNICFEYDGTDWSSATDVQYSEDYKYYAYYPYIASPYTPDFSQSTVDGKFSLFIADASDKFHQGNQSTKAAFNASDLMIAQGTHLSGNTVRFTMDHKKALAVFGGTYAAGAFFGTNIPYNNSGTGYFLMKPETPTQFSDWNDTYTLYAGTGSCAVHAVGEAFTNYTLSVVGPDKISDTGGSKTYTITSYKENSAGTKTKPAAWTASYDTDGDGVFDDAKPSWLTTFTEADDGSLTAKAYTVTAPAVELMTPEENTATYYLSHAEQKGSSTDYFDLSDPTGVGSPQYTANCYMVHAPGYYKLPLVYGNAIGSPTVGAGAENTVAYKPGTVSSGVATFLNHNTSISAPWLSKSTSGTGVNKGMGINVNGAQLIWQDVNGLTTDYAIEDNYLKFRVPAATIAEGNAVIAVKNGSTIVWSWHIWVTNENYSNTTTVTKNSHAYKVTHSDLGWVNLGNVTKSGYGGHSCTVKITQGGEGGLSQTFDVIQKDGAVVYTPNKAGNNPFYQWGRKDPFVPGTGLANANKTVYVGSGVPAAGYTYSASTGTIYLNIKNPWIHYYYSSYTAPYNVTYRNLWNAQNSSLSTVSTATKKTIYDPCPPGFCVPTNGLISETHTAGETDATNYYIRWTSGATGDPLWFSLRGYRSSSSASITHWGSYGLYWTATPSDNKKAADLSINGSTFSAATAAKAAGLSIRPVEEE